jgi:DNA-binding transcriptional regulator YdaS (Cro superfamily)
MRNYLSMTKPNFRSLLAKRGMRMSDLASCMGVNRSSVTRWAQKGVPAARVIDVEKATGIKRKLLRPDLYG